jgi:hypothetical protein
MFAPAFDDQSKSKKKIFPIKNVIRGIHKNGISKRKMLIFQSRNGRFKQKWKTDVCYRSFHPHRTIVIA